MIQIYHTKYHMRNIHTTTVSDAHIYRQHMLSERSVKKNLVIAILMNAYIGLY